MEWHKIVTRVLITQNVKKFIHMIKIRNFGGVKDII